MVSKHSTTIYTWKERIIYLRNITENTTNRHDCAITPGRQMLMYITTTKVFYLNKAFTTCTRRRNDVIEKPSEGEMTSIEFSFKETISFYNLTHEPLGEGGGHKVAHLNDLWNISETWWATNVKLGRASNEYLGNGRKKLKVLALKMTSQWRHKVFSFSDMDSFWCCWAWNSIVKELDSTCCHRKTCM